MTEAQADNEQSGRFERPERRTVDPTVKFALDFVKASEDRQEKRIGEAEARADARNRDLIAALNKVTNEVTTRMGTHADAQRVILALIALVVLMALLLAAVRGVAVGEVGEAAGALVGGVAGASS